jgi:hypothetical protein
LDGSITEILFAAAMALARSSLLSTGPSSSGDSMPTKYGHAPNTFWAIQSMLRAFRVAFENMDELSLIGAKPNISAGASRITARSGVFPTATSDYSSSMARSQKTPSLSRASFFGRTARARATDKMQIVEEMLADKASHCPKRTARVSDTIEQLADIAQD